MKGIRYEYRAHPVTVFYYLKPFLFILLLPLLRALIDAMLKQEVDGLLLNEIILTLVIFTYSTIKWKRYRLTVTDSSIIINSGLIFRRSTEIPKQKISTIETVRYVTDYIFGSTTLQINTEAGRRGKADCEIKLYRHDAEKISSILSGTQAVRTIKFSAVRVAIMAATASSAFTGLIFTVPIIKKTGDLLGTAIEEILLARINEVSSLFDKYAPPIINTVTVIFLALYAVSFLITFFRCVNFRVGLGDKGMVITNGLITRRTINFRIKPINSVIIEQTPLMRMLKRFFIRVSIGGYGDNKGNRAIVVPSAKKSELRELFAVLFPKLQVSQKTVRPAPSSRLRFYNIPTMFLLLCIIAYFVLVKFFPVFKELLIFALIICVIILVYYYSLAEYNVKNSAISVDSILYARYTRWSATREMYCEAGRVGVIHITKWPVDRKRGTCNIRIIERSEKAESITVKHISYKEIKNELSGFYGFE